MDRDLVGYGCFSKIINWPNQAKIAINFVINYEEGAEANILDGDPCSENYLADFPGLPSLPNQRHLSSESLFEYGSRAGIWRLLRLFDSYQIPLTFFMTGLALERQPALAQYLKHSQHEIAGHGYRWINYRDIPKSVEREHMQKTCKIILCATEKQIYGWYTGRKSEYTRELVVEQGLLYDSDSYADDLPYWIKVSGHHHLIIPYALDTNDARYATSPGWSSGEDFYQYLCASFDHLYLEGHSQPKMMTVGLHSRFSGRPGRSAALKKFIEHTLKFQDVWYCRRSDIALYWQKNYKDGK